MFFIFKYYYYLNNWEVEIMKILWYENIENEFVYYKRKEKKERKPKNQTKQKQGIKIVNIHVHFFYKNTEF